MSTISMPELLAELQRRRVVLAVNPNRPDRLRYHPIAAVTDDLAELLRQHKPALLTMLRPSDLPSDITDWPDCWRQEYEERAAIMEFDGNLSYEQAQGEAEIVVRAAYSRSLSDRPP